MEYTFSRTRPPTSPRSPHNSQHSSENGIPSWNRLGTVSDSNTTPSDWETVQSLEGSGMYELTGNQRMLENTAVPVKRSLITNTFTPTGQDVRGNQRAVPPAMSLPRLPDLRAQPCFLSEQSAWSTSSDGDADNTRSAEHLLATDPWLDESPSTEGYHKSPLTELMCRRASKCSSSTNGDPFGFDSGRYYTSHADGIQHTGSDRGIMNGDLALGDESPLSQARTDPSA
ncbi:hypothetical protein GMORB2_4021 [Geosmithia morbida]|uniref:Uncharacterized protein n=1 Tax=Geosmithia morbida TaxID=1094350 RepID=A0A9P4Z0I8_9HYPO|nr:uncharacterized protein GMORB2_4021 [Geosmithia morbida]KAF4125182.1 hypothetical protein GMORB2_4021 [Geosmithia morbida]